MPRYLVERKFPEGLELPMNADGAKFAGQIVDENATEGVTWVHSYVTADRTATFCVYDASDPEALRRAAVRNGLPIEQITEVRVLDPYFYTASA